MPFFVYVTTSSADEARAIGRAVVEGRLAACANILSGMRSIYRWEGALHEDQEAVLILKTSEERLGRLEQKVKELHSYSLPCIVALPIEAGNPDYLKWIEDSLV